MALWRVPQPIEVIFNMRNVRLLTERDCGEGGKLAPLFS